MKYYYFGLITLAACTEYGYGTVIPDAATTENDAPNKSELDDSSTAAIDSSSPIEVYPNDGGFDGKQTDAAQGNVAPCQPVQPGLIPCNGAYAIAPAQTCLYLNDAGTASNIVYVPNTCLTCTQNLTCECMQTNQIDAGRCLNDAGPICSVYYNIPVFNCN